MLFLRDIALARNSANLRICPLRSLFAMLLRDVVRLGIASKFSLLSPYTTSRSFSSRFGFSLPPILGVEPERRQSEPRAKAEWRHSVKTNPRLAISRPFSNAKIVRNNDITNFFEQKMSLFPLLKKRGSLWYQKRLSLVKRKGWLSR